MKIRTIFIILLCCGCASQQENPNSISDTDVKILNLSSYLEETRSKNSEMLSQLNTLLESKETLTESQKKMIYEMKHTALRRNIEMTITLDYAQSVLHSGHAQERLCKDLIKQCQSLNDQFETINEKITEALNL